jgi:hypothetical protein
MRHTPTQTRFLVNTGGEVMTDRFVEVCDDYPVPAAEQIISLGGNSLGLRRGAVLGLRRADIRDDPVYRARSLLVCVIFHSTDIRLVSGQD